MNAPNNRFKMETRCIGNPKRTKGYSATFLTVVIQNVVRERIGVLIPNYFVSDSKL